MRDEKAPATRKSTSDFVVCQSSDAEFHCLMSSGVFQARQTCSMGAEILVSTVIFWVMMFTPSRGARGCEVPPLQGRLRAHITDSASGFSALLAAQERLRSVSKVLIFEPDLNQSGARPGPGHALPSQRRWQHDRCTPASSQLAATSRSAESGQEPTSEPAGLSISNPAGFIGPLRQGYSGNPARSNASE